MANLKSFIAKETKKVDTEVKQPKIQAPKDVKKYSKGIDSLSFDERQVVMQGILAKSMREGFNQKLSDADKYGLENLARTKAPTLSTDLVDYVIESDILSPNLVMDMWSSTTLGRVIPMQEVMDLANAITIDNDDANMRVKGEASNLTQTDNTYNKMKHFVYDIGGYATYSYLAEERSIIDLAVNKSRALENSWGRAVESFAFNGNNAGTHPDANYEAGDADIVEKFGKGLRHLGAGKATVDFGGSALTDLELVNYVQEMGLAGGVYLDPNAVVNNQVALFVTQGLYNRMARCKDYFLFNSPLSGNGQVSTFMGIPVFLSSYMPQKTNASGFVDATASNNVFDSCVMVNTNTIKMYTYGTPTIETDKDIIAKSRIITFSAYAGMSSYYDSLNETFPIDTTRKNVVLGININSGNA